jgi:arylsulfate sulfotransferase
LPSDEIINPRSERTRNVLFQVVGARSSNRKLDQRQNPMKHCILNTLFAAICAASGSAEAASVMITGQTAGPTPFIRQFQLTATPANSIASIKFQISPKPGSVTRPLTATYSAAYLVKRGYYNAQTGAILLPVFGLYANYSNQVTLTYGFTDGTSQQATAAMATPVFTDSCGYANPTIIQARTNSTALSYDYFLIRNACNSTPVVMDTDGQVRWLGTAGITDVPATFYRNAIFLAHTTFLYRVELDGTWGTVRNFSSAGVTNFHHNMDPGKQGLVLDVDTAAQVEATNIEVDEAGNILKTWNLADIISNAMTAGGDTPSQFVRPAPEDWFHNNATTYRKSDDSLLVSSRENFVIALDYTSGAIKWILGDTTKHWYQFQSLRHFALALGPNTLPPIGQHALSITHDNNLLLFDNGKSSVNHTPTGADRTYSAPRKYQIDLRANMANELWNYSNNQALYSTFCSSIYEDSPLNYLVDYAYMPNIAPPNLFAEILGLDASGNKVFDYRYPTSNCATAYNSIPVHWEQLLFTTVVAPTVVSRKTHGSAGTFNISLPLVGNYGIECRSGGASGNYQIVATFAVPVTVSAATVTPGPGGTGTVSGTPVVSGNQVTVNLTNVSHGQKILVNLIGVNDGTNTDNISIPMGVLIGDATGNKIVNSTDVSEVKFQSGLAASATNFRRDITASGAINSTDLGMVKSRAGSSIP